jgi:multidrug resistance efflux pump
MKILYTALLCALAALTVISINLRSDLENFHGIADTKEMVIRAEFGVEIKKIRITPGQRVFTGDTLVEMRSPEIELKISEYTHLVNEMRTRSKTQANLSKSEMKALKSEQEARIIEIRSELQQLESQYAINRELIQKLRSVKDNDSTSVAVNTNNPTLIRIRNLKEELARLDRSNTIMDENLRSQISYGVDPLKDQLEQYSDQLRLYTELNKKLFITAQSDGIVGAVFYKEGEKVSAFDSIATIHSESPSFVLGYIHENIYSSVSLGQSVTVRSLADKKHQVSGKVIGVGTRIVEYPLRLRKVPEVVMWGREVTIRIPEKNQFLLGEKVLIRLDHGNKPVKGPAKLANIFSRSAPLADTVVTHEMLPEYRDITRPGSSALGIEASGAVFLEDIQKYCIISDESPMLYLMNSKGEIENEVQINGLKDASDMEGITIDEKGYIYIVCSQSPSKKGKLPDKRKLLMRIRRDRESFTLDSEVKLLDLLTNAAQSDTGALWTKLIKIDTARRTPDIEGIACRGDSIFLGFKEPLLDGKSAVLKIQGIDKMFSKKVLNSSAVKLWNQLDLKDKKTGNQFRISDMQFIGDDLYVLSCCTNNNNPVEGRLWVLRSGQQLDFVKSFTKMKPEGIAVDTAKKTIVITFDNGSDRLSQFFITDNIL